MPPPRSTNRLANETSDYLRQHMHNPVDWWPWCEAALREAGAADRPLLVSIGYSACHWCHVMERESFEDEGTAALMNEHFVCIKVDREERPDVDQIYMETILRLHGHGGWPLTVFCKPDGEPFYAGTYYPPEPRHGLPSFQDLLRGMAQAWDEQRDKIDETSARILEALADRPQGEASARPGAKRLAAAADDLMQRADLEHGGFGAAPKFPTPANLELLLAAEAHRPPGPVAEGRAFLRRTCEEMARRGLYDQLGGGFHRYCVDAHWGVPHFEKMLYDQGQLMRVYTDLWRRSGGEDEGLVWPVVETATWLAREMTGEEGGFFASQDADSEGVEGRFYVWTPSEVEAALGPEAGIFCETYGVTPAGNFEGSNVLWDTARGPREDLAEARSRLFTARSARVPPATDRKRVAAWNGYTISGLAYAGSLLDRPELLAAAVASCDFVLSRMRDDEGRLLRVFAEGRARVPAFLDDTAAMLSACLDLSRAGAGPRFAEAGFELADQLVARFHDAEQGDLFLAPSDGEPLPHRPRSDPDGATPHSAGLAVLGLLRVATLSGRDDLRGIAETVIDTHAFAMERSPTAFPTLLRAAAWAERGLRVAVIVGDGDGPELRALAGRARHVLDPEESVLVLTDPGGTLAGIDPTWLAGRRPVGGRATAYLCHGVTCSLPIHDPERLAEGLAPIHWASEREAGPALG